MWRLRNILSLFAEKEGSTTFFVFEEPAEGWTTRRGKKILPRNLQTLLPVFIQKGIVLI